MKKRKEGNKRKKKERGRGTADQGEKEKKEREREWGSSPFCIGHGAHSCILEPICLVRNPLPVDVGTIGRTTSNMCVDCCVFSLKLAVKRFK
jgi:hypothetical protein